MRTTLDLPDKSMKALLKITRAKTKTEAVTRAIDDFIRRQRIEQLIAQRGKLHFEENWRDAEEVELKKYENSTR